MAITTDNGVHWLLSPVPPGLTCTGVDAGGAVVWLTCRTAAGEGLLLRSTDGGRTWRGETAVAVPLTLAMMGARRGLMVAAGSGATARGLFRTTDGGFTWMEIWPAARSTATPVSGGANTRRTGATPAPAG